MRFIKSTAEFEKLAKGGQLEAGEFSFKKGDFESISVLDTRFEEISMVESNFKNATLDRVHASSFSALSIRAEGLTWRNSKLDAITFDEGNLRGATFQGCELRRCGFSGCNLEGARIVHCQIVDGSLSRAVLRDAFFHDLRNCSDGRCLDFLRPAGRRESTSETQENFGRIRR